MKYIGFDMGPQFAWAVHDGDTIVETGFTNLNNYRTLQITMWKLADLLLDLIKQWGEFERFAHDQVLAVLPARPMIVASQARYEAIIHLSMGRDATPYRVNSKTLKKFATGNHKAGKEQMMRAARMQFPSINILTEHEADAIFLATYAATISPGEYDAKEARTAARRRAKKTRKRRNCSGPAAKGTE